MRTCRCRLLIICLLQYIQEELLSEEIDAHKVVNGNHVPPPLARFLSFITQTAPDSQTSSFKSAMSACMRDMYHYARISGLHVLECIMDTALSSVKREQLEEASNVCVHYCYYRNVPKHENLYYILNKRTINLTFPLLLCFQM